MVPVFVPMALGLVLAATWLVQVVRFVRRLHDHHPDVYERLGRPVVRFLWMRAPAVGPGGMVALFPTSGGLDAQTLYAPAEIAAMVRLLRFVLSGEWSTLDDAASRALGRRLRGIAVVFPLAMTATVAVAVTRTG